MAPRTPYTSAQVRARMSFEQAFDGEGHNISG